MMQVDFNVINSLGSVRPERAGGCSGSWFDGLITNGLSTT
jgi:hypothetical protein